MDTEELCKTLEAQSSGIATPAKNDTQGHAILFPGQPIADNQLIYSLNNSAQF